ncbi:hypothetical protein CE91St43_21730 [Oscillospiraceae bacterium]|nr:hypothetical protein CE91St43_21730 [Oscillospiraceae bacterium]
MTDEVLNSKIKELKKYKREVEELQHNIDAIQSEVKEEMLRRGVEQIMTSDYKISWQTVSSVRLDTKSLKEERPEIYARYAVTAETKRFLVS